MSEPEPPYWWETAELARMLGEVPWQDQERARDETRPDPSEYKED